MEAEKERRLSQSEKEFLLRLASDSIRCRLEGSSLPKQEIASESVKQKRGAFVTLHKHGRLRGCIGYIQGIRPLDQAVIDMAEAAAFDDPRFPPVTPEELPELDLEISVLSPLKEVKELAEIEIGKHGLYLTLGAFSGLLLPQVATENGWDRETFLEQTCLKAGLPPEAYKDEEAKLYLFSAEVFS
jgi:AmmeMemoRadiSam system protein A